MTQQWNLTNNYITAFTVKVQEATFLRLHVRVETFEKNRFVFWFWWVEIKKGQLPVWKSNSSKEKASYCRFNEGQNIGYSIETKCSEIEALNGNNK